MMTFAAHFINQPLARYYQDYRVLCEANLAVQDAFDLDIVQAISDPYRETADFGAEIIFPEDGLPISKTPLLANPEDLQRLPTPSPYSGRRMSDRLEAIRRFREQLGGTIPIMGWVEGAMAEASDLRGAGNLLLDLIDRPAWVEELLEHCANVAIAFARAQVEAGADIIGLGDAIASQVSAVMYRQFALPYEQRIFDAVHDMGALARLHICGNTTHLLTDMVDSGADIIDIDWMVDIKRATQAFGDGPALCGNFDPVRIMLQGSPAQVEEAVVRNLRAGNRRMISAAGCEIPDGSPIVNLQTHAMTLHHFNQYKEQPNDE
jgi:uroporphyrinogen decarboxylase